MSDENEKVETEDATPIEEWDIYTFELCYVDDAGEVVTKLLDATHAETDDDHVEFWDGEILLLMVQRSAIRNIRNVTLLDMNVKFLDGFNGKA